MTKRFDLYLNTAELGSLKVAEAALLEEQQLLTKVGFRYTAQYLENPQAFALDPAQLPLSSKEFTFNCHTAAPAFIDDYLPDDWGRKVLAKLAMQQKHTRINAHSVIDTLTFFQQAHSRIGALCFVEQGQTPIYKNGIALSELEKAEQSAQKIDQQDFTDLDTNTLGLVYLANSGTGVGGARPKALVYDQIQHYLAKFNRISDPYNNARVELACLNMARAAGINIGQGRVIKGINQREVLLLERFDITDNARKHLITANGLLKHPHSQQDPGHSFRYDDLYKLLQQYSCNIETDLKQLLHLMLFNRAINNTDDHERNFSFIHNKEGWQLAPAYDLVPSLGIGEYHAAGYGYQPYPPTPTEAENIKKIFGLPQSVINQAAQQIKETIKQWPEFAQQTGVEEQQILKIQKAFQP